MTGFAPEDYDFDGKYLTSLVLEIFVQKKEFPPIFVFNEKPDCPDHRKEFICTVNFSWNGANMQVSSIPATSKKMAKHFASGVLLNRMGFTREWLRLNLGKLEGALIPWPEVPNESQVLSPTVEPTKTSPLDTSSSSFESANESISSSSGSGTESTINYWNFRHDFNYIETLNNCIEDANEMLSVPEFTDGEMVGPSHAVTFTIHCTVYKYKSQSNRDDRETITAIATSLDKKKIVKKMAALEMIKKLVSLFGQETFSSLSAWPNLLQPRSPVRRLVNPVDTVTQQLNRITLEINAPGREGNPINYRDSDCLVTRHYQMVDLLKKSPTLMQIKDQTIRLDEENILDLVDQISEELGNLLHISYMTPFGSSHSPENGTAPLITVMLKLSVSGQLDTAFVGHGHGMTAAKCSAIGKLMMYYIRLLE